MICTLILACSKGFFLSKGIRTHLISLDEKTGIQALSRNAPTVAASKGRPRRIETEYTRNGTTCLMAAYNVGTGKVLHHWTNQTRKEEDFLHFAQETESKLPQEDNVVFLLDQLNTHMSESLVIWAATKNGYHKELGKKGREGILKNKASRRAFLEREGQKIRFVFTPKHCSWLNPVENWFSKLQRHVIKYGDFSSVEDLENKIREYILFYNNCLAGVMKWKFKGFSKNKKLNCIVFRA